MGTLFCNQVLAGIESHLGIHLEFSYAWDGIVNLFDWPTGLEKTGANRRIVRTIDKSERSRTKEAGTAVLRKAILSKHPTGWIGISFFPVEEFHSLDTADNQPDQPEEENEKADKYMGEKRSEKHI